MPQNRWNDEEAAPFAGLDLLAYRSRLLAGDRSVINIYGGNTSSKLREEDHLGRPTTVLWVKGSGSDMKECTGKEFAGLRLDEVTPLIRRERMTDEEMVAYLSRCAFEPGRPRQSIETLLHAFLPFPEIDHTHPDAIIALACTQRGRDAASELFGNRMSWVDYIRPGFTLSKQIAEAVAVNPAAICVVMGKHGLVTWGTDAKSCYESTIEVISEAERAIEAAGKRTWTGGLERGAVEFDCQFLPVLRGAMSAQKKHVLCVDAAERVLSMVNTPAAKELSQVGAACPDHLVHVKRLPLFLSDLSDSGVRDSVAHYRSSYERYFTENAAEGDVMFDSAPRCVLIPGYGLVTGGRDAGLAEISRQLYHRAVEVIEGAEAMGSYASLTPAEAFAIEYWPLELYKLSQRPPERELAGHIALVTGGGGGIGRAVAQLLARNGAHVCVTDINEDTAQETAAGIGKSRALAVQADITDEAAVERVFQSCVRKWGGVDIVVCSAGIASSSSIEETTLSDWERNFAVLARGYFLTSREAFRVWKRQAIGGSLVFVTSKNSVAAGKNASAYSSAKAAEQHLARCLAEEGGAHGIRVNCVLPDAVLQGSSIWSSEWRDQRAKSYGIHPEELEEFYRNRTTLKRNVFPEDIAEAVLFFASERSSKTTGAALTVDAGVPAAYLR